jgi:hypothetical protein
VDREIHFTRGKKKNLAIRANRRISIMISLFPVVSRQRIHDWGEKKKKRISFFFSLAGKKKTTVYVVVAVVSIAMKRDQCRDTDEELWRY